MVVPVNRCEGHDITYIVYYVETAKIGMTRAVATTRYWYLIRTLFCLEIKLATARTSLMNKQEYKMNYKGMIFS